jgi:hypothetical protein
LPDHARLVRELRLLERRTHGSGKDTVEHPRNGHDDFANVVCGVFHLLTPAVYEQSAVIASPIFGAPRNVPGGGALWAHDVFIAPTPAALEAPPAPVAPAVPDASSMSRTESPCASIAIASSSSPCV